MLAVKPQRISVDDFLDWELTQDQKWELVDGVPILRETRLMAGGTAKHSQIAVNIMLAIGPQLRGGPCRVYGSDLKVRNATSARYPDVTIDCGTRADAKAFLRPTVHFSKPACSPIIRRSTASIRSCSSARTPPKRKPGGARRMAGCWRTLPVWTPTSHCPASPPPCAWPTSMTAWFLKRRRVETQPLVPVATSQACSSRAKASRLGCAAGIRL
jgi:hypothetical protein